MNGISRMRDPKSVWDGPLLVIIATAVPIWNFYGFAINFFRDTWADAPVPVVPISYGLNACSIALLPSLKVRGHGALRVAALLGTAMAVWSAVGMAFTPASKLTYTAVPTVLGTATAALATGALVHRRRDQVRSGDAASLSPLSESSSMRGRP